MQYVPAGLFSSRPTARFDAGESLPELRAPGGDANQVPAFLILARHATVVVSEVPQHSGGTLFAVDQLRNPDSTVFRAGGLKDDSVLISGGITATGTTEAALEIHRLMVRTVTKGFRRVRSFWPGPEALEMFRAGARLTPSVRMPRTYDLRTETAE